MSEPNTGVVGTYLHNDVEVNKTYYPNFQLLLVHPIQDGAVFTLRVVEEDWGSPDDDLGAKSIFWHDNGEWHYFNENDDDDPDFKAMLVW